MKKITCTLLVATLILSMAGAALAVSNTAQDSTCYGYCDSWSPWEIQTIPSVMFVSSRGDDCTCDGSCDCSGNFAERTVLLSDIIGDLESYLEIDSAEITENLTDHYDAIVQYLNLTYV